jgi:hypothetical protein
MMGMWNRLPLLEEHLIMSLITNLIISDDLLPRLPKPVLADPEELRANDFPPQKHPRRIYKMMSTNRNTEDLPM